MLSNKEIKSHLEKLKKDGTIIDWREDYGSTAIFEFYQNNHPHWFWQMDINNVKDIDNEVNMSKSMYQHKGKKHHRKEEK